ncbi:Transcription initiation factor TFIID subunit 9B [Chytridiales sp. JEL 0842]|nr:Transcription initiation factor TFIID subunit 9B [Chytridiales sp. JEL 0842]
MTLPNAIPISIGAVTALPSDPFSQSQPAAANPSTVNSSNAVQDPNQMPRDAKLVSLLLEAMGVEDYDQRVVPQLLEMIHRYVLDTVSDAQLYAAHASRSPDSLEIEDLKLAIEAKLAHSFTSLPSREVMQELAEQRNSMPLPFVREVHGIRMPPERNTLTGVNFQIVPKIKQSSTAAAAAAAQTPSGPSPTPTPIPSNRTATLPQPTFSFAPPQPVGQAPAPAPMMLSGGGVGGSASMEEDYDD